MPANIHVTLSGRKKGRNNKKQKEAEGMKSPANTALSKALQKQRILHELSHCQQQCEPTGEEPEQLIQRQLWPNPQWNHHHSSLVCLLTRSWSQHQDLCQNRNGTSSLNRGTELNLKLSWTKQKEETGLRGKTSLSFSHVKKEKQIVYRKTWSLKCWQSWQVNVVKSNR